LAESFIILTSARSGPTWLADTINRHPDLSAFWEQFNPVWDFLEVDRPEDLGKTSFKKVQTRSHCEVISNYDAVRKSLAGSPYADLLEQ
jgi:hypothetical protein